MLWCRETGTSRRSKPKCTERHRRSEYRYFILPGLNRVSAGEYFSKVLFKPPLLYVSSPGTLLQGF